MPLAAIGDTWGIPGPLFLFGLFIPAAVVLLAGVLLIRRLLSPGRDPQGDLHPYKIALLDGGAGRVIATAVAALRADGAVEAQGGGLRVTVTDTDRTARTPLDEAVHGALAERKSVPPKELPGLPQVRQAIDDLERALVRDGLMLSAGRHRARRLAVLPLVLLELVGIARLIAGLGSGQPVLFLVIALIVLGLVNITLLVDAERCTAAGKRVVADASRRYRHLNPSQSPAWATYGAPGMVFGVALFGTAALVSMDPAFAEESQIHSQFDGGGGGGDGGGGCGGGGCGGCGGCGG
ncbi:hypothetical protein GCM10023085_79860 [Actinomadura viridis]|uniref:Uncharacterized protein (TIGR04222 family) n=1 Tax=Actinomadura viridis TaxID=58110 RepID=A0A931GIP3_9ACTN|nr:TIGR04222 domain-containing membrane protein [Actinomadura viridis]MBG6088277.1 uncharacterized protein (TIGR04222 family) [Actinomadura viridis]